MKNARARRAGVHDLAGNSTPSASKHSGTSVRYDVRGVDDQAGGVCHGYRRPRLLQPPLAVACLNGDKGPRGVSLDYPLGIAWRRHRFDPLDGLGSIRVAALREDRVYTVDMHDREKAAITGLGHDCLGVENRSLGRRRIACQGLGDDVEVGQVGRHLAQLELSEAGPSWAMLT